MSEESIVLTGEQEAAVSTLMSGNNVFLTGEAGTGKSTVIRAFRERCGQSCVVLAPTGIAAVNAGGSTIHSFFLLKPGLLTPSTMEPMNSATRAQAVRAARTIIIDEVSMVRADLLSAIDIRLRELAGGPRKEMPFGGKQVVLVGDFFQLPPVVREDVEANYLAEKLGGAYAFQTDLWAAAKFACVFLRTVHRQSGDPMFVEILNALRGGMFDQAADVLNRICLQDRPRNTRPICLCTTNAEARRINEAERLCERGEARRFSAKVSGSYPESDFPTDATLDLTVGNRVMILTNERDSDGKLVHANGDMGVVTGFEGDGESAEVQVRLDGGSVVSVAAYTWTNTTYMPGVDPETGQHILIQREIGSFTQIPLKLAYAITIHKSQGLSFDSVNLNLGNGCFSHGQLYTALSRCRTLAGLRLDRPVRPNDLIVDRCVIDFYAALAHRPGGVAKTAHHELPECDPEAMQYYLRQIDPRYATEPSVQQFELSFEPRITCHPDLDKLLRVHQADGFSKYDAPILNPLVEACRTGNGVTESELKTVSRIMAKY